MDYAKQTRDELDKALAQKPNEFKAAVENLIKRSENLVTESAKLRADNTQIIKEAEIVATNCLELTQIIKDMNIWLGSVRDLFPKEDPRTEEYHNLLLGLAKFVVAPQSIKAGVVKNASND